MNKKLLLSFVLAAAMTGCINDSDVPSGNGDNPAPEVRGGNMEISFVVPTLPTAAVPLPPKIPESMTKVPPKNTR